MKRIAIFGGTFDPPHNGHIAIAKNAVKQLDLDLIYFVPTFVQPYKINRQYSSPKNRVDMLKLAIKKNPLFKISLVEVNRKGISYTVDTVKYFKKKHPTAELFLIIGSDNLTQFLKWKSPQEILNNTKLAVYKRRGYKISEKINLDYDIIKGEYYNISSTMVRNKILKSMKTDKLISQSVKNYIRKNSLYKSIENTK